MEDFVVFVECDYFFLDVCFVGVEDVDVGYFIGEGEFYDFYDFFVGDFVE